jgi:hypothetical protein
VPTNNLYSVSDAARLIEAGRILLLGGEEKLLRQLPRGTWIGGTSANFMAASGGVTESDRVFVTDITDLAEKAEVRSYSTDELRDIGSHYPENGFTALNIPGLSPLHQTFACEVQTYSGVFNSPLYGWIAGVHVSGIGKQAPKTFAGDGTAHDNSAAAMHVTLPESKVAKIDIINLFDQGDGAQIEFATEGFEALGDCLIDGRPTNFASYVAASGIDTRLPLVANYNGAMINVSVRDIDANAGKASFYAPVFKGVKYKFAKPVQDYVEEFNRRLAAIGADKVAFSCNCILNYLYAELEGKRSGSVVGPMTFGEIAYVLLNQTLVYLSIESIA